MSISLRKNMGMVDRTIHGCVGTALVIFGVLTVQGTIGAILILLGAPLLLTAIIGFCPGHVPFGRTARRDSIISGSGDMKEKNEIVSVGIETLWLMPRGEFPEAFGRFAKRARA
jgi:hypothetical protein